MDILFSEDPKFRRIQYKKLSDNVREWNAEISGIIEERLPHELELGVEVVFQKVDDEKGYAQGTAVAKDQTSGKQIGIPVIVKSWHLAPIDLFFFDGQLYPLNDSNIARAFYQGSLGVGLAPQKPPPGMADDVFADSRNPPLGGKYSYSSPFSMLNNIDGTLGAEQIHQLKKVAAKNPYTVAEYARRGTFSVLRKYADAKPSPTPQDAENRKRALSVLTIKRNGPNNYQLYSATDEVYDPVLVSVDRQGLKKFLDMRRSELWGIEGDPLSRADRYGHFTVKLPKQVYGEEVDGPSGKAGLGKHRNPWVFDPLHDTRPAKTIETFGAYAVKDPDGVTAKGFVIPNVVDFNGKPKPIKLFLGKVLGSYQGRISGVPLEDDEDVDLIVDRPDTGKTGVLIHRENERVLATCPFQVTSVTVFNNIKSIGVIDYQGNQANLIMSPNMEGIVRIAEGKHPELAPLLGPKDNYLVSGRMTFIRIPRLCSVSESPEAFRRKTIDHLSDDPVKVAMANERYVFRGDAIDMYADVIGPGSADCRGTGLQKAAFDFNALERHEAEFLLRYWGLDDEKTASVLDAAPNRIVLEVRGLHFPPAKPVEKVASPQMVAVCQLIEQMRPPIENLVKVAANIDDAPSVDTILGLGFMNPENISKFVAAKPVLWDTTHLIAKLLLASRLGAEDIPEEAAQAALVHLQRIIDGLGKLKMMASQEKTSAALPGARGSIGAHQTTLSSAQ